MTKASTLRTLQFSQGYGLVDWLNHWKDDPRSKVVAWVIRARQQHLTEPPPGDVMDYFANAITVRPRIVAGHVDIYADGDRAYSILTLHKLLAAGLVDNLQVCPRCDKWFFSMPRKEFCSRQCWKRPALSEEERLRAKLRHRKWRIETFNLPTVAERIQRYRDFRRPLTTREQGRLEKAVEYERQLRAELKGLKRTLNARR